MKCGNNLIKCFSFITLPAQDWVLHICDSTKDPLHKAPPFCGTCSTSRDLCWVPPPQVAEQFTQSLQADNWQSTTVTNDNSLGEGSDKTPLFHQLTWTRLSIACLWLKCGSTTYWSAMLRNLFHKPRSEFSAPSTNCRTVSPCAPIWPLAVYWKRLACYNKIGTRRWITYQDNYLCCRQQHQCCSLCIRHPHLRLEQLQTLFFAESPRHMLHCRIVMPTCPKHI